MKKSKDHLQKNRGHRMLFRSLNGELLMALHQPNTPGKQRLHLFRAEDTGNTLAVKNEIMLSGTN